MRLSLLSLAAPTALLLLLLIPATTTAAASPAATAAPEALAADKANNNKKKAPKVALMHNRLELNSLSFEELDTVFQQGTIDVSPYLLTQAGRAFGSEMC